MSFMLAYRALVQIGAILIFLTIVCGALCLFEAGGVPGMVASGIAAILCLTLVVWIDWRLRVIRWHTARMIESALQEALRREQEQEESFQRVLSMLAEDEKKEGREP